MANHDNSGRRPRRLRPPLTDSMACAASITSKPGIYYDGGARAITGFGLRISAAGARSWVFNFTINRRERRMTIGSTAAWPAAKARQRAVELRRMVDIGVDPLEQRQAERAAPEMGELLDLYLEAATGKRSISDDKAMIAAYIRPRWGSRKVASITTEDVEGLHREISKGTPIRANRVVSCASAVFRLAIKRKMRGDNPCRGLERNAENKRERYLTLDELTRLGAVLDGWPDPVSAAAVRLLLLTGCRRGELLRATWSEFDFVASAWTKPASHCKNKREHRLPISAEVKDVLTTLPRYNSTNLLFPNSRRRPWSQIAAWPEIRKAAGLAGVRIHDLRHSAASLMVSAGHSLELIGGVLGHSDTATTQRYAHLMDGALRGAVDGLGRALKPNGAAT